MKGEVVPQVIKSEFVVGAVSDVGKVGFIPLHRPQKFLENLKAAEHISLLVEFALVFPCGVFLGVSRVINKSRVVDETADAEPQKIINLPHPSRVTFGKIVVYGNHVNAPTGKGIQVNRGG